MTLKFCLFTAACIGLLLGAPSAGSQVATSQASPVMPSYKEADVLDIAQMVGSVTGKAIVVEARARKPVTWQPAHPIPRDQLYLEFARMLSRNGLSIQKGELVDRVTVAPEAKE